MATIDTRNRILKASRRCLIDDGYAALTTRKVAEAAGVPLSQIHYHFGSKDEMILSLLADENDQLLDRQSAMFGQDLPFWKRWDIACDYLDADLESGYVRLLHEMIAAGWSSPVISEQVASMLRSWIEILTKLAIDVQAAGLGLGVLAAEEIAALSSAAFVGAEAMILLGLDDEAIPLRKALRQIGQLIKEQEEITP